MSSVTNIWPSQYEEDPIPIVGISNSLVINFAVQGDMHSRTIENAPAFSIAFASFKSFKPSSFEVPSILNSF